MQIQKLNIKTANNYHLQTCYNKQVTFSGLENKEAPCMFVFDIDGTFATGPQANIDSILKLKKERNACLVYATGRTAEEIHKLRAKLETKGLKLPLPDYLVSNNGQFLHKNVNGVLEEDLNYHAILLKQTNFDRAAVKNALRTLAHTDCYKYSAQELSELQNFVSPETFEKIKASDPEFYDSKISYYEWNPSVFMIECFLASDINTKKFKEDINKLLGEQDIRVKFVENLYSKPIMDACREDILLQSHPKRRHADGSMTAFFVCPADKADGIKYLRHQLKIPFNEILMAGNDDNDISMANLTLAGSWFVCVNNASNKLKAKVEALQQKFEKIFITANEGSTGILEGIKRIIHS